MYILHGLTVILLQCVFYRLRKDKNGKWHDREKSRIEPIMDLPLFSCMYTAIGLYLAYTI